LKSPRAAGSFRAMHKLVISLPDGGESAAFDLADDVVTVGRLEDNNIAIRDVSVSSHHAQLTLSGKDYVLKDAGSTNGTKVNGEAITEKLLQNGDKVVFGNVEAVYQSDTPSSSHPVPEAGTVTAEVGSSSRRPEDFGNEAPFQKNTGKEDPAGRAIMGFAFVAVFAFVVSIVMILLLHPPA
jgi:pSer/pThr/pTyr-binding forkhead associated (FHA) protein